MMYSFSETNNNNNNNNKGQESLNSSFSSLDSSFSSLDSNCDSGGVIVENPFAYRSSSKLSSSSPNDVPASVYLGETSFSSSSTTTNSSPMNATHFVKFLTLILIGFAGGLLYHLTTPQEQEQMLRANDQIVQRLATTNQQQTKQIEQLRQAMIHQQQKVQKLRTRNQLMDSIEQHEKTHLSEEHPHAILWTHQIHDARLQAAHEQAELLLRNDLKGFQQPQHHEM